MWNVGVWSLRLLILWIFLILRIGLILLSFGGDWVSILNGVGAGGVSKGLAS